MIRMPVALYPGSFDPLTNGHLDIIRRAARLFDSVIVAIANNEEKKPLFTLRERVHLVEQSIHELPIVRVDSFGGLLVDYVDQAGGQAVIRGLRAISDFEFEFQLALMNRKLNERVETIFMMTGESHFYTSSRLVKEVASLGGNVSGLIPDNVVPLLVARAAK